MPEHPKPIPKIFATKGPWQDIGLEKLAPGTVPPSYLDAPDPVASVAWKRMFAELHFFARVELDDSYLALWLHEPGVKPEKAPVVQLDSEGQLQLIAASVGDAVLYVIDVLGRDTDEARAALKAASIPCSADLDAVSDKTDEFPDPNDRSVAYQDEAAGKKPKESVAKTADPVTVEDLIGMPAKDRRVVEFLKSLQAGKKKIEIAKDRNGLIETIFLDPGICKPVKILDVSFGDPVDALIARHGPSQGRSRWDSGNIARHFTIGNGIIGMICLMSLASAP